MQRLAATGIAAALAVAMAGTAASAKIRAVIVQWGEAEVVESDKPLGPEYQEHSLGAGRETAASRWVNHSDHVPAQLCRSFGFEAWLAGEAGDTVPERILMRVNHPLLTRPDGATSTQDTLMMPVQKGATGTLWTFDNVWEVQPGDWTFELLLDGQVVASKTFVVTPPEAGSLAAHCPGSAVS